MTQPAKVQEPSMEEILASIRRIIADDEAKPAEPAPVAAAPVAPAPKPAPIASVPPPAPKPAPVPAPPKMPEPAASNSQDDIDAMLASLDAATSEEEVRPAPVEDVFELTDDMVVPEPEPEPMPAFQRVEPNDDIEFTETTPPERASQRFDAPAYDPPPRDMPQMSPQHAMLSQSTVSAVESAFSSLANTVLSNNARTLEDLVKEMLRPMLKSWLDDNLPGLVERIVKAEIERVSRGNGR